MKKGLVPVVAALTDEVFALAMMVEMISNDQGKVEDLIGKCLGSVQLCGLLTNQLRQACGLPVFSE